MRWVIAALFAGALVLALRAVPAWADPHLVCDRVRVATHYIVTGLPGGDRTVVPDPTGVHGILLDLADVAAVAPGAYTVSVSACRDDTCSAQSASISITLGYYGHVAIGGSMWGGYLPSIPAP